MTPYSLKDPKDPLTAEGAEVVKKNQENETRGIGTWDFDEFSPLYPLNF
jgi:hypothetical protein